MAQLPSQRTTWRSIVTIGMNLRQTLSASMLVLAMVAALIIVPGGASAKQSDDADGVIVCNVHGNGHRGGELVAFDTDAEGTTGLRAMPGNGKGLARAAANSPALSECGVPAGGGWGGSGT